MQSKNHFAFILAASLIAAAAAPPRASAQPTLMDLVIFNNSDGNAPYGSLIADSSGDLLGTTAFGLPSNYGEVFEIPKTTTGYATTPTVLFTFNTGDNAQPYAGLLADSSGNLFGTTAGLGVISGELSTGNGAVFEIANTTNGYATTPTVLFNFDNAHGEQPYGNLIADSNGDLFGTTTRGGSSGDGTVFEIVNTSAGYATTPTVLVSFDGTNGANPQAGLLADSSGNLFGTTFSGGSLGNGTVFEIVKTTSGYATTPTVLFNFDSTNGAYPSAGLIADSSGDLFGTTSQGGSLGYGTVFEIVKISTGYASTPTVLFNFDSTHGGNPAAGLVADFNGSLFGTTNAGGQDNYGTAFEIVKTKSGYASTPTVLVSFDNTHGAYPVAALIADSNANLFGTTAGGGQSYGTVFEITGSGFVPPGQFSGAPGTPNCAGSSVSTLAHTYGGIAASAKALGYSTVAGLQSAIATYCGN